MAASSNSPFPPLHGRAWEAAVDVVVHFARNFKTFDNKDGRTDTIPDGHWFCYLMRTVSQDDGGFKEVFADDGDAEHGDTKADLEKLEQRVHHVGQAVASLHEAYKLVTGNRENGPRAQEVHDLIVDVACLAMKEHADGIDQIKGEIFITKLFHADVDVHGGTWNEGIQQLVFEAARQLARVKLMLLVEAAQQIEDKNFNRAGRFSTSAKRTKREPTRLLI